MKKGEEEGGEWKGGKKEEGGRGEEEGGRAHTI